MIFQNKDLQLSNPADIPSSLPDVCIAYKLHLECGRYINLYDWFQCWLSIVTSSSNGVSTPTNSAKKLKKTNEGNSEDEKLQARFSRAVSELQVDSFGKLIENLSLQPYPRPSCFSF